MARASGARLRTAGSARRTGPSRGHVPRYTRACFGLKKMRTVTFHVRCPVHGWASRPMPQSDLLSTHYPHPTLLCVLSYVPKSASPQHNLYYTLQLRFSPYTKHIGMLGLLCVYTTRERVSARPMCEMHVEEHNTRQ